MYNSRVTIDLFPDYPKDLTLATASADLVKAAAGSRGIKGALVVRQILLLMERLVEEEGVGFVGCQKCIHPLVMDYLKQKVKGKL